MVLLVQEEKGNLNQRKTKSALFVEERKLEDINVNKFPTGISRTNIDKKSKKTINLSLITDGNGNNEFVNEEVMSQMKEKLNICSESDLVTTKQCNEIYFKRKE